MHKKKEKTLKIGFLEIKIPGKKKKAPIRNYAIDVPDWPATLDEAATRFNVDVFRVTPTNDMRDALKQAEPVVENYFQELLAA